MTNPDATPANESRNATTPRLRRPRFSRADAHVGAGMVSGALFDPHRPLLVHLVVTRRCNLACGYCTEYDDVSAPVPVAVLRERIDHLARLRTVVVTLTGGETLLHPDVAALVAYVRERGMTPAINTNGFLGHRVGRHAVEADLHRPQTAAMIAASEVRCSLDVRVRRQ